MKKNIIILFFMFCVCTVAQAQDLDALKGTGEYDRMSKAIDSKAPARSQSKPAAVKPEKTDVNASKVKTIPETAWTRTPDMPATLREDKQTYSEAVADFADISDMIEELEGMIMENVKVGGYESDAWTKSLKRGRTPDGKQLSSSSFKSVAGQYIQDINEAISKTSEQIDSIQQRKGRTADEIDREIRRISSETGIEYNEIRNLVNYRSRGFRTVDKEYSDYFEEQVSPLVSMQSMLNESDEQEAEKTEAMNSWNTVLTRIKNVK